MNTGQPEFNRPVTCPECNGTGVTRQASDDGETSAAMCPVCEGTGVVALAPFFRRRHRGLRLPSPSQLLRRLPGRKGPGGGRSIRTDAGRQAAERVPEQPLPERAEYGAPPEPKRGEGPRRRREEPEPEEEKEATEVESHLRIRPEEVTFETRIPAPGSSESDGDLSLAQSGEGEPEVVETGFSVPHDVEGTVAFEPAEGLSLGEQGRAYGFEVKRYESEGTEIDRELSLGEQLSDEALGAGTDPLLMTDGQTDVGGLKDIIPPDDALMPPDPLLGPEGGTGQ